MSLKDKKITSTSYPFWHLQVSPALSLLFLVWRKPWRKWSQDVSRLSSLSLLPRTWRDPQDFMKVHWSFFSFMFLFFSLKYQRFNHFVLSLEWNFRIQTLELNTFILLWVTIIVISFWPCLALYLHYAVERSHKFDKGCYLQIIKKGPQSYHFRPPKVKKDREWSWG